MPPPPSSPPCVCVCVCWRALCYENRSRPVLCGIFYFPPPSRRRRFLHYVFGFADKTDKTPKSPGRKPPRNARAFYKPNRYPSPVYSVRRGWRTILSKYEKGRKNFKKNQTFLWLLEFLRFLNGSDASRTQKTRTDRR